MHVVVEDINSRRRLAWTNSMGTKRGCCWKWHTPSFQFHGIWSFHIHNQFKLVYNREYNVFTPRKVWMADHSSLTDPDTTHCTRYWIKSAKKYLSSAVWMVQLEMIFKSMHIYMLCFTLSSQFGMSTWFPTAFRNERKFVCAHFALLCSIPFGLCHSCVYLLATLSLSLEWCLPCCIAAVATHPETFCHKQTLGSCTKHLDIYTDF